MYQKFGAEGASWFIIILAPEDAFYYQFWRRRRCLLSILAPEGAFLLSILAPEGAVLLSILAPEGA